MDGRERLTVTVRGGTADRKPIVVRSISPGHQADGVIVPALDIVDAIRSYADQAVLAEVKSPFGLALERGLPLNDLLRDQPAEGEAVLRGLDETVRSAIDLALGAGADGVFYVLDGAYPPAASPMQYGGHYLEVDRAILSGIAEARLNILYVPGGPETYFDCLTDLSAHAIAWDLAASGVAVEQMRAMRPGALAAADSAADILLLERFEDAELL
ncbi:MAG TPA: hypothetical protein PLL78_02865 [Fimbriimonadaceae bacterium]|nr:hypothetical protein [Fimbriimonadaceae bacterium]HRJ95602.1 hypothetical protein [Fimbriimonadaceae bacterium]